jgi:hypothetical protein
MVLTLRHFILKQQVFNLYRYAIRNVRGSVASHNLRNISNLVHTDARFRVVATRCIASNCVFTTAIHDPLTRKETIMWIRAEFERNRHLTDLVKCILLLFDPVFIRLPGSH